MPIDSEQWLPAEGRPFVDDVGRVLLPLSTADFCSYPPFLEIGGNRLAAKTEFHITLIGSDLAARIGTVGKGMALLGDIAERVTNQDPWRYRVLGKYLHIRKPASASVIESIVVLAEVNFAQAFYKELESALREELSRPPLHVTLYTFGDDRGIGLPTPDVMQQRTVAALPLDWFSQRTPEGRVSM